MDERLEELGERLPAPVAVVCCVCRPLPSQT